MSFIRAGRATFLLLTLVAASMVTAADPHPGQSVYQKSCASCHDHPDQTRAPTLEALKAMRYGQLHFALTEGKCRRKARRSRPQTART